MKKILILTIFLTLSCGDKYRSSWDYQAGFCEKVPECLADRQHRNHNPSIYVWITSTQIFFESEFFIPEYDAVLWVGDTKCTRNLVAIYEKDIIPYGVKCDRDKDIHHSHYGFVRVVIGNKDTYQCLLRPELSTEDISIYKCQKEG